MRRRATIIVTAIVAGLTSTIASAQMKITTINPSTNNVPGVTPLQTLTIRGPFLDPNRVLPGLRNQLQGISSACGAAACAGKMEMFIINPSGDAPGKLGAAPAPPPPKPPPGAATIPGPPKPGLAKVFIIGDGGTAAGSGLIGGSTASGSVASALLDRLTNAIPITAGTPAPDNAFTRVVAITYNEWGQSGSSLCTGIMLDGNHVLTAGHCGCGDHTSYRIFLDDKTTSQAVPFVLKGPPSLLDQRVCRERVLFGNDLALLTMNTTFTCPSALRKIVSANSDAGPKGAVATPEVADCRTDQSQLRDAFYRTFGFPSELLFDIQPPLTTADSLLAVGYGYTETHSIGARMQGTIPIKSVACTEPEYANICAPYAEMILASAPGSGRPTDTCGGDSGGPIFKMIDGRYLLVGITSRPAPFSHVDSALHCGGGGIYTLIGRATVQNWLRANGVDEEQVVLMTASK
jgi:Trypsin